HRSGDEAREERKTASDPGERTDLRPCHDRQCQILQTGTPGTARQRAAKRDVGRATSRALTLNRVCAAHRSADRYSRLPGMIDTLTCRHSRCNALAVPASRLVLRSRPAPPPPMTPKGSASGLAQ